MDATGAKEAGPENSGTTCKKCKEGWHCPIEGIHAIDDFKCPAGTYSPAGSVTCFECQAGYACPSAGTTQTFYESAAGNC